MGVRVVTECFVRESRDVVIEAEIWSIEEGVSCRNANLGGAICHISCQQRRSNRLLWLVVMRKDMFPLRLSVRVDLNFNTSIFSDCIDDFIAFLSSILDDCTGIRDVDHVREVYDVIRHARKDFTGC